MGRSSGRNEMHRKCVGGIEVLQRCCCCNVVGTARRLKLNWEAHHMFELLPEDWKLDGKTIPTGSSEMNRDTRFRSEGQRYVEGESSDTIPKMIADREDR